MDKRLIEFIKQHKNMINSNDFEGLYAAFDSDLKYTTNIIVSSLTKALMDADIPFLNYMDYIPDNCFYGLSMDKLIVPENIKHIGWDIIDCDTIILHNDIKTIADHAWTCKRVEFKGTKDEWDDIMGANAEWMYDYDGDRVFKLVFSK